MDSIDSQRLDEVVRSNIETLCRHFFPAGRKEGGEWKIGDVTGGAGDSLGIQLTGANAGLWHDRATGDGGKFTKLLMQNRGVTFRDAVELIERTLGVSATQENSTTTTGVKQFGNVRWHQCVQRMTPDKRAELCTYRNYSPSFVDWLVDHQLIGIFKDKNGVGRWAFPVHHQGKVAAVHCEVPGEERKVWFYWPKLADLGLKLAPFVLGDLATATEAHLHESQWDLLAEADVLTFDQENQGIALIATLGSSNGALAGVVNRLSCAIYLWPQRDVTNQKGKIPSQEWLAGVRASLARPARVCWIPNLEPQKDFDFNDWRRRMALSPEDVAAIMRSAEVINPQAQDSSQNGAQGPPEETAEFRKLRGASILDYAERQIDSSKNLLGNRWLSRLCGGFIVAPSGHGKSSLSVQAAICWSCGRVAFAIKPAGALRILIVQAEDDEGDMIEMAQMCERLKLTASEQDLVRRNTHIEWVNDVTGAKFFQVLDNFLTQFPADLLIINPYTAYQGGDIRDDQLNNEFLRMRLAKLLNTHNCGALPIHHSPKTNFQKAENFTWFDWMYSMAGGASLTNWARCILVIAPTDTPGTYRFIAAKRFEKIGWRERECWFAHSVEGEKILWVPASEDQIALGRKGRNASYESLLAVIPVIDPIGIAKLITEAKQKLGIGENKTRQFLKVLLEDKKVYEHLFPRPRTGPEVRYARAKQTEATL